MIHRSSIRILLVGWAVLGFFSFIDWVVVHGSPSSTTKPQPHVPFHVRDPAKLQSQLLTKDVQAILDQNGSYSYQAIDGYSGTGIVIQDIQAPSSTIGTILLNFDKYPQRIPKVAACESYTGMGNYIHQHLTLGYRWLSLHVHVQQELQTSPQSVVLVWTLDPTKASDLEESTGYWYIETHPTKGEEGWSRVTYHVHVTLMEWVPSFVWKFMTKQALEEATSWIKKYSEAEEKRQRKLSSNNKNSKNPYSPHNPNSNSYCDASSSSAECLWEYYLGSRSGTRYVPPIGISRYFLVSSVMGLLFFNTYLYFSHYR